MALKIIKNCVLTKESEESLISRRDPQQENIIFVIVMRDDNYFSAAATVEAAAAALGVTITAFSFGKNFLLKSDTSTFHHVHDC